MPRLGVEKLSEVVDSGSRILGEASELENLSPLELRKRSVDLKLDVSCEVSELDA